MSRTVLRFSVILAALVVLTMPAQADVTFVRGDADANGKIELTDAIFLAAYLFQGSGVEPPCMDSADWDDTGELDLTDVICITNYLYLGGDAPEAPFPYCGIDPNQPTLGCEEYDPCH